VSNELLKKLGLGLLALLVVCNTVRVQGLSKDACECKENLSAMRSRMGKAMKMRAPELGPRMDREQAKRPQKGKEARRGKQQKQETK